MHTSRSHQNPWFRRFAVSAVVLAASACVASPPSTSDAERILRSTFDKGDEQRVRLLSLEKTDGRSAEIMGVKTYDLMFTAKAEFVVNAMYSGGAPLTAQGSEVTTTEYRRPSSGFSWNDFALGSQGFRPARKGDQLHLQGTVSFEKRESGWVATGLQFTFTHDSSTRDQEAVRAEVARQEAEAQRLREEQARLEQRIEESKRINRTIGTFSGYSPSDGYTYGLVLTVTDAGVKTLFKTSKYSDSPKTGSEEWSWFGDANEIGKGAAQFIWNGVLTRPAVYGAGGAFFDDESQRDAYYVAVSNAFRAWQERFPEVAQRRR